MRNAINEKNTTMGERLKALRLENNMTQEEVGAIIGVQNSAIRKYEAGSVVNPPTASITKLAEYFNVSTDYLLGKTDWRNEGERQAKFSKWDKKYSTSGELSDISRDFERVMSLLPMYEDAVSAGTGEWLKDGNHYSYHYFANPPKDADFALRVRGDSMEPMYFDGDIVFVKANRYVEPGQVGVFCLNNEGYMKVLVGNKLTSYNPKYKPIRINEWDSFFVAGRVVGKADNNGL